MDSDPFRIFLSGSTADFGQVRSKLSDALSRGGCHVIHEADFPQTEADTVLKLAHLIAPCHIVIHLVGPQPGSVPAASTVAEYLAFADKDGAFLAVHPELRATLGDFSSLTYTQWEMCIARHLGLAVLAYADPTHADPAHPQRAHLDRLVAIRRYPSPFDDESDLYLKVMADLLAHCRRHLPATQLPPAFRPSNLPGGYIGRLFIGRDTFLADLRASLLRSGSQATAITQAAARAATGISGLGGIGKTHAAVEYADRHRADYSALLFVSGDSPEKLHTSLAALCGVLGLESEGSLPPEESVRVAAALHWLATHPGWLLIVDNVDDEPAARALTALLDRLTTGHILITSRLHEWPDSIQSLDIEVLSPDAATDLLLALTPKRRPTPEDPAHARTLATLLDGLPLALHQAAGYINEQRLTLPAYLTIYEEEAATLLAWFSDLRIPYERPDKLAPRPVLITWKTSFEKLDPETRHWLLVFSYFAPDPIPEFLLDSAPDAPPELKARHRAGLQALAQAEKYCLLSRDAKLPRFKVHRLVQQIIRLSADDAVRTETLAMAIQLIDESDCGDPLDVRSWKKWTPVQPHAISLCAHSPNELEIPSLCRLLSAVGVLLNEMSLYEQAEPFSRRAVAISEAKFGSDHPFVATCINNLATLFQDTNRLVEAEPLYRRALAIEETTYGPAHPEVAGTLNNLATLLQSMSRLTEAEALYRRALAINESIYGPDHPGIALDLNNLGQLLQITNRLDEAEIMIRRALHIDITSYGNEHPRVASRFSNLAKLLQETNRLSEAEPLMRSALKIDEFNYSSNHTIVAVRLNNLATLLKDTNRLEEAEPLMRRALAIDEASHGSDHPNVAIRLNNLAQLLKATNRQTEVEPLMARVVCIFEKSLGKSHPHVATALNNFATWLHTENRMTEAEPLLRRALAIDEASFGSDHPDVARDLSNLAVLLQATHRLAESESLMRRSLAINEACFGKNHPHVARDLHNLAQLLKANNHLTEAEPLMCRAFSISVASLGLDHPHSQGFGNSYINLLRAMELSEEEIQQRIRAILAPSGS